MIELAPQTTSGTLKINECLKTGYLISASEFAAKVCRAARQYEGDENSFGVFAADDVEAEAAATFDQLDSPRLSRKQPILQSFSDDNIKTFFHLRR
jgi:hypothetical protein